MKKNYISLVLALVMLFTTFVPAMTVGAAVANPDYKAVSDYWYAYFSGGPGSVKDATLADIGHNGSSHSAHFVTAASDGNIFLYNMGEDFAANEEYFIEFYAKVVSGSLASSTPVLFYWTTKGKTVGNMDVGDTDSDGWTKYTWKETALDADSRGSHFHFQTNNAAAVEFYIDDVTVYKTSDATKTNLIKNGGFESNTVKQAIPAIDGFKAVYTNPATQADITTQNTDEFEISYDLNTKMHGDSSLYLYRRPNYSENVQVTKLVSDVPTTFTSGSNYTLSFYTNKAFDTVTANRSYMYYGTTTVVYIKDMTHTEENGWHKYSYTQTASSNQKLMIMFRGPMDLNIDNLTLTKDSETENLIPSGNFDVVVPEYIENYEPKNVIIDSWKRGDGAGDLILSWRNPAGEVAISDINVYDITTGSEVEITDSVDTNLGAVNEFYLGNTYADGKVHTFKLVFDFTDGETKEIVCQKKARNITTNNVDYIVNPQGSGWSKFYTNTDSQNPYLVPVYFNVDRDVAYGTSDASYHLSVNRENGTVTTGRPSTTTAANTAWAPAGYYYVRTYLGHNATGMTGLPANTNFRIKLKAKGNNIKASGATSNELVKLQVQGDVSGNVLENQLFEDVYSTEFDWQEFTADFSTKANATDSYYRVFFHISCSIEDLWIDDIACYALDSEGNEITTTNYVESTFANFETYTAPATVGATVEAGDAQATIKFTDNTARSVYVYEQKEDTDGQTRLKLRAIADPAATNVTIDNLVNGQAYTFVLKTENANFVISDAQTIGTVTPEPADYIVSDYELYKDSTAAASLSGAGSYSVKVNVKNNAKGNSFTAALIVARYLGTELKEVYTIDSKTVAQNGYYDAATSFEVPFTIPSDESSSDYTIKAFVWDDFNKMLPLADCISYETPDAE